nr:translation initiation factor IF-2-like [Peromyscus maniculatus bairdii]
MVPPFSSQARVPPPPATLRPLLPARPHRARVPRAAPTLELQQATRTRHPFASSRSARPGNEDAAPVLARRSPNPVSALRVRASSHTIYSQKGTEGGADPVSPASSACAPRGGAEPSRAERSRAEPGGSRVERSPAERGGGERSRAERSRAPWSPAKASRAQPREAERQESAAAGERTKGAGVRTGRRRKVTGSFSSVTL